MSARRGGALREPRLLRHLELRAERARVEESEEPLAHAVEARGQLRLPTGERAWCGLGLRLGLGLGLELGLG